MDQGVKNLDDLFKNIMTKINLIMETDLQSEILILSGKISADNVLNYVPRWPLMVHLLSAVFCLGSSAAYHLVYIESPKISAIFSTLDYGGICILIMGSTYPLIFYVFACDQVSFQRNFFLTFITVSSIGSFVTLLIPRFASPSNKSFKSILFIILGISAFSPFVYIYGF